MPSMPVHNKLNCNKNLTINDMMRFDHIIVPAVCEPRCKNGGVCTAPNTCVCKVGYYGKQCELGKKNGLCG